MGKHRSIEQRIDRASEMIASNSSTAYKWEMKGNRYTERELHHKAVLAYMLHFRSLRLTGKWEAELKRLNKMKRRLEEGQRAANILDIRKPRVEKKNGHHHTPKELKELLKRERLAHVERETRRKKFRAAGVDFDFRTANSSRSFRFVNMGSSLRVSIHHFDMIVKRKEDRTPSRILAWAEFDEHCHRVHKGALPTPNYEPGIDNSMTAGMSNAMLDAHQKDNELRGYLGRDMHGMLVEIIYFQKCFRDLVGHGYGDERVLAGMFRRALDLAASYFKCGEDLSFGRNIRTWREKVQASA